MEPKNDAKSAPLDWIYLNENYEFLKKKGSGSFGNVYKAKCRKTGKYVAVKHIEKIFKYDYAAKKVVREVMIL